MKRAGQILLLLAVAMSTAGCVMVSCDRAIPGLTWYWSAEAVQCRKDRAYEKQVDRQMPTNSPAR
jgi:hypothetical protein